MVKIGILGLGNIAQKHIKAYQQLGDVDIAVTDLDDNKKADAEKLGVHWRKNKNELLLDPSLQAIDICTPTLSHTSLALTALQHGKHVFCEKPLTLSSKDCKKISAVAEKNSLAVMVGYLYRYHSAFQKVKSILDQDIIGQPHFSILRIGGRGSKNAWKHQSPEGGGVCFEMLVHMLDLALWYFGTPKSVNNLHSALVLNKRNICGENINCHAADLQLLHMQSKQNTEIYCQADLVSPAYVNYIEIHGDNGSIFASILDIFPMMVYCKENRGNYQKGQNYFTFKQENLFLKQLGEFVTCIKNPSQHAKHDALNNSLTISQILEQPQTNKEAHTLI